MAILNHAQVIHKIITTLFEAESRRLIRTIDGIIEASREFLGKHHDSVMIAGKVYSHSNSRYLRMHGITIPALPHSLSELSHQFLKDEKEVELDKQIIRQVLHQLLIPCCNEQEVRDQLPDSLVSIIPWLKSIPRKLQNPGYLIRSDQRQYNQFLQIMPKIDFYVASRLIY